MVPKFSKSHRHPGDRRFSRRGPERDPFAADPQMEQGGGFGEGRRGGGFSEGRRGGGGRGLGRVFAHGDLRLVVLMLIADKPRHGYELIKAIEERVNGAYSPSPGVVYPTLTLLEELGHIVADSPESTRKLYRITEQGSAFLAANRPTLDGLLARMDEVGQAAGHRPPAPIVRAMENLKMALRLRLQGGTLTTEQIAAIAAVLDEASRTVEQI